MPRTCLACASPERAAIEKGLVAGEPLRNIAKRVSISPAGLLRHKNHVAKVTTKAGERREERLGDNLLDEMRRVQRKAWELLARPNRRAITEPRLLPCARCESVWNHSGRCSRKLRHLKNDNLAWHRGSKQLGEDLQRRGKREQPTAAAHLLSGVAANWRPS